MAGLKSFTYICKSLKYTYRMNERKNLRIELIQGDITRLEVDAIVNAANSGLLGGGGVDGAIHRAAGPDLLEECRSIRRTRLPDGLPTGEAVITGGYRLGAKYVIHTVGPVWSAHRPEEADRLLVSAYLNSLNLAAAAGDINSIAFPAISTGVYGFPAERAAELVVREVSRWAESATRPERIVFCLFSSADLQLYRRILGGS
jgi:O-acetyl-ADP-ribose deacetylase (regulator of RNase III)